MLKLNKLFVTILIASLVLVTCEEAIELIDVQKTVDNTNPAVVAILTQLRVKESNASDAINTYKCTVGSQSSGRLACTGSDKSTWTSPHDVELKLRCPKSGSGLTISYVEILFSVTSASVNCHVHEGSIGSRYIGITVNAWTTLIFNYSAYIYGY